MDRRSFEAVVEEALRRLPDEFRSRLDNVTVLVEDEPSPDLLRSMGLPRRETLLGVYQGTPYPERGVTTYGNVLPDRIVLFQRPIESMGGGPAAIRRRIADTVVHEIGHYFGLSDDEMDGAEEELDARFGSAPGNGEPRAAQRRDDDLDDENLDDDEFEDEDLDEEDEDLDEDDLDDDEFEDEEEDEDDLDDDEDLDDEDEDLDEEDEDPDEEDEDPDEDGEEDKDH